MSFGIDINGRIALRSYFLKVSGAKNIAQLLIRDPYLGVTIYIIYI